LKYTNVDRSNWYEWLKSLQDLFSESFGTEVSSEYLEWRYNNNSQKHLLFCTGGAVGSAQASYSACPVQLIQGDCTYTTMVSMTTMTHPAQQGKGWFPFLAKQLYERAHKCGITFVWGFPNSRSHRTFVRDLRWTSIYEIPTLSLSLTSPISIPAATDLVGRDDTFSLEYTSLPQDGLIKVDKSKEYLKWRYEAHPKNKYFNYVVAEGNDVMSYVVLKNFEDEIDLVDVQVTSESDLLSILSEILSDAIENNKHKINCWSPINHFSHLTFEKLGFQNSAPITYFGGRTLSADHHPASWENFNNWYIQMGDSDVY
jgi:hypothetical protein